MYDLFLGLFSAEPKPNAAACPYSPLLFFYSDAGAGHVEPHQVTDRFRDFSFSCITVEKNGKHQRNLTQTRMHSLTFPFHKVLRVAVAS